MPDDTDPYPVPPVVYSGQRPPPGALDQPGSGCELLVILYVGLAMLSCAVIMALAYNLLRAWKVLP